MNSPDFLQIILVRRKGLGDWADLWLLLVSSAVTIPVGLALVQRSDPLTAERSLGGLTLLALAWTATSTSAGAAKRQLPDPGLVEKKPCSWQTAAAGGIAGLSMGAFRCVEGDEFISESMVGSSSRWVYSGSPSHTASFKKSHYTF